MMGAQAGQAAGRVRGLAGASVLLPFSSLSHTRKGVCRPSPGLPRTKSTERCHGEQGASLAEEETLMWGNIRAEGSRPGRAGAEAWRRETKRGRGRAQNRWLKDGLRFGPHGMLKILELAGTELRVQK